MSIELLTLTDPLIHQRFKMIIKILHNNLISFLKTFPMLKFSNRVSYETCQLRDGLKIVFYLQKMFNLHLLEWFLNNFHKIPISPTHARFQNMFYLLFILKITGSGAIQILLNNLWRKKIVLSEQNSLNLHVSDNIKKVKKRRRYFVVLGLWIFVNTVLRILLNFIVVVVASSLVRIFEFFPSKEIGSFDRVGP